MRAVRNNLYVFPFVSGVRSCVVFSCKILYGDTPGSSHGQGEPGGVRVFLKF